MIYATAFYSVAALTLLSACFVVFSRNIIYSAFSLLFTLMGVAAVYAMLSDDFMAVVQLLLYVGGILVLILFAVMLTNRIDEVFSSNLSSSRLWVCLFGAGLFGAICFAALGAEWKTADGIQDFTPATARIGSSLLGPYLLPFEMISVVLLIGLIGAVVVARKESRTEDE